MGLGIIADYSLLFPTAAIVGTQSKLRLRPLFLSGCLSGSPLKFCARNRVRVWRTLGCCPSVDSRTLWSIELWHAGMLLHLHKLLLHIVWSNGCFWSDNYPYHTIVWFALLNSTGRASSLLIAYIC